ncbi:MAG: pyrroloquinoline quinone-dependent dehydrogenase [Rhodospirillaceae bacterium]|mgnify:CR=1 FL=1|nr:pyrroloquinoline quinone-dependent dehydrogenase [Rhodospirillaceae bacterium]
MQKLLSFFLLVGVVFFHLEVRAQSDWPNFGNDKGGSQYSSLDQLTPKNVADLKVAWIHRSGDFKNNPKGTSLQVVPIHANGLLYYCTPLNRVFALNPETGEEVWVFDPHSVDKDTGESLITGPRLAGGCRGVAYWEDNEKSDLECSKRIFKGDAGGNLWAIDADSGKSCAEFGSSAGHPGRVSNADYESHGEGYLSMPSPGVVIGDVVVGSTASNDTIQDANDGIVRGWDVRSGELKWEFNPIPAGKESESGAANVWSTMSSDPDLNLVFLPTTSPSTDYYGGSRRFPIPYSDAIVALEAETGGVVWHFQTVRHDLYDYDLVGHPLLVTIKKDEKFIDVAILQTKMGWLFVFDRSTGNPIWPIEEMKVPTTNIPEDEASPTQPKPSLPVAFAGQNIEREDLFGLTPIDKAWCKSEFDKMRYEGLYTPPDLREALLFPSALGGGNWGGAAFDPATNTLVIKAENLATRLRLQPKNGASDEEFESIDYLTHPLKGAPYASIGEIFMSPLGIPCTPTPWGTLSAIDMGTGQMKWQIPLGQVKKFGITVPASLGWGSPNIGGPIVTGGGLIFVSGTMDEKIRAINVRDGKELWQSGLPHMGSAVPITYMSGDRQFVLIAAGGTARVTNNLGDAIVAFALPKD